MCYTVMQARGNEIERKKAVDFLSTMADIMRNAGLTLSDICSPSSLGNEFLDTILN